MPATQLRGHAPITPSRSTSRHSCAGRNCCSCSQTARNPARAGALPPDHPPTDIPPARTRTRDRQARGEAWRQWRLCTVGARMPRRCPRGTHRLHHDLACGIDGTEVILRRVDRPFDAKHRPQPPRLCKHRFGAGPRASPSFPKCQSFLKCGKKNSTPAHSAGFEPARGDPKRFLVSRLNRSATSAERASRVN